MSTRRIPLREHPMFSHIDENSYNIEDSNVEVVIKPQMSTRRIPLREHPIFSQRDENNHNIENCSVEGLIKPQNKGKHGQSNISDITLKEKVNRFALFDISNTIHRTHLANNEEVVFDTNQASFNSKENLIFQASSSKSLLHSTPCFGSSALGSTRVPPNIHDSPFKAQKRKLESDVSILNRNLFNEDLLNQSDMSDHDYSQLEVSNTSSYDYLDDDFLSDTDHFDNDEFAETVSEEQTKVSPVPKEYATLGAPSVKCEYCHAYMWKEERVNKNVTRGTPKFSICCRKGLIKLPNAPPTPSFLWQLYNDPSEAANFQKCSRVYNSLFCFTSTGGTVDNSLNNGGGPYIYRLNGQNHHVFGSLIPDDGNDPKFCQLYIYDTENEISNRMRWVDVKKGQKINEEIVEGLMKMLDENNELVKEFRIARDRFEENPCVELKIILKVCRSQSGRENHIVPSDEVAAIMVGDLEDPCANRDIIIDNKIKGLERITNIHPKLMALQYPILFPCGEDGFHKDIKYNRESDDDNEDGKREHCTMKDYYSYRFQVRHNEGMSPRLGGRLFQQYIVDAFSAIEQSRLWWFKTHQTTLRNELYSNICDQIRTGDGDSSNVGKSFILPAGFVGSKRYMQQNFQDALAVCRHVGHPDLFLTMTCNSMWDEITQMMKLIPGGTPPNNPDIISRVFRLKLNQLLDDIKKKEYFGKCIGVMYVVEFQKRGLPHVHMLIWLDAASKMDLKQNVDKYVSAEIPDPLKDPAGYAAVKAFMIHGPCGVEYPKSPCMKDYKCSRHYPKKYSPRTMFDESGFPLYKRRNTEHTVKVRKAELDNQWVVPYNRDLLVKYQCHINVEVCCHARSLKYLFKYCLKGHDRATVEIRSKRRMKKIKTDDSIDEIQAFFDGRYICGCEAAYRTFGFDIHHRSISVERLSFHLPENKNCTFRANESLKKVAARAKVKLSKLEAFFFLNSNDINARQYTYDEIPRHYVWNDNLNKWTVRKRGIQIGRLVYTHHSSGELWFLRLLLSKIRGPTSFKSLRTVNGVLYPTFKDACKEFGLLDDDNEWHEVMAECSKCGFPPQMRQLFVHMMVNCQVTDLKLLWITHCNSMTEDILFRRRLKAENPELNMTGDEIHYYALAEIDSLLKSIGKALKDYPQMPQPPSIYLNQGVNSLILEETTYDRAALDIEYKNLAANFNAEQLQVYDAVLTSVDNNEGGLFFVYGSGGCGKTYLWRTLICKLRSEGKIVLPVASSGIAATLLPGGRTAHSRFKIPIVLDDYSLCGIGHQSETAELLKVTSLIIWDEAPMQHRYAFECLDRSLRDLMKTVNPERYHMPFGGITVLLGGDFRQILPVIPHGQRSDIVSACITRSRLWPLCKVFLLKHNMRLTGGGSAHDLEVLRIFAQWVLDIGNGKNYINNEGSSEIAEFDVSIPPEFCSLEESNSVEHMVQIVFPNFLDNFKCPKYISERAILTPTNQTVSHLNSLIVEQIPGQSVSYFSLDKAEDFGGTDSELDLAFPIEYLNSLNIPGLPHHELQLKEGVVVMLMRNLNQTLGLCNGTRMMITKCLKNCVQCEVICGSFVGTRHFIPRMECSPTDSTLPFKLIRKQMPLQICYAMTINKSQGQSLKMAGLYLPNSVFTHGQFYVAVSRVTSPEGLRIFIDDDTGCSTSTTQNVVYKEIFYNLPVA